MIEELTKKQEEKLPIYRGRFLSIGLKVGETDRKAAEEACALVYACAGLPKPVSYIWLKSPMEGCIGSYLLNKIKELGSQVQDQVEDQVYNQVDSQIRDQVWDQVEDQVDSQIRDQVWDQVDSQVWDQVRNQVDSQVWDQVWDQVEDQVDSQIRDQVWGQVDSQVWNQVDSQVWSQVWDQVDRQVRDQIGSQVRDQVGSLVWDQVRDQVWDQVRDQVYKAIYGSQDAAWLSFYAFFLEEKLVTDIDNIRGLISLAETCGWIWPFEKVVILTELPVSMCRDDQNRLHLENGLALGYSDGWGVYSWHGIRVPKEMITDPDYITSERIQGETNQEIKRCMIEKIGWDTYLSMTNAVKIQEDRYGSLLELKDGGSVNRFVRVKDTSTERQYAICVPKDVKTAHEGIAWTFDLTPEEYMPEQES